MFIEPLEARIAPAAVFRYTDLDGDLVTITASKAATGSFSLAGVLTFSSADPGAPRQLQKIDLSAAAGNPFAGTDLVLTVQHGANGDGFANVGAIDARAAGGGVDLDLGTVTIPGDLGQIDAGDGDTSATSPAIKALNVRTMGLQGLATQASGGSLHSDIQGRLGAFTAKGTVQDAFLDVRGGVGGTIGAVAIGGSLLGLRSSGELAGTIEASGDIGPVKIGGDVIGSVFGGGSILSDNGKIASVTIGGSLLGLSGNYAGLIRSGGDLGPVKIAHDLRGGSGADSGAIANNSFGGPAGSALGSVTIGGTLAGSTGTGSGQIFSEGKLGAVKIGHDLKASDGNNSGSIFAQGDLASLFIGGSLIGGKGNENGNIRFGQVQVYGKTGSITVVHDVIGGTDPDPTDSTNFGYASGRIVTSVLASLKIGGSILGSSGVFSGSVSGGTIGTLTMGGSVVGGTASNTGYVAATAIGTLKIGGDLNQPAGESVASNGEVFAQTYGNVTIGGTVSGVLGGFRAGTIKIGGDLDGAGGGSHGFIDFSGGYDGVDIQSLTIGGSLIGASASTGLPNFSGYIRAGSDVTSIKIGGDLLGGSITGSGYLSTSGAIEITGRLGAVTIGGSIIAGTDTSSGYITESAAIYSFSDIGSVTIGGNLVGNASGTGTRVTIAARGLGSDDSRLAHGPDVAIGKIAVGGRVEYAFLLAGFVPSFYASEGANADAQIGAVTVGGDWIASSIVAGIENYGTNAAKGTDFPDMDDNTSFGDANDHRMTGPDVKNADDTNFVSRIGSIAIQGAVYGTSATGDHFGFVAQQIGSFKAGGIIAPLAAATLDTPLALALSTGDVTLREE